MNRVSYIEIYNEKIFDLLEKKESCLKIQDSNGVVSINCRECIVSSEKDLLEYLLQGNNERTVGGTNMNERSSRSHAIFRIVRIHLYLFDIFHLIYIFYSNSIVDYRISCNTPWRGRWCHNSECSQSCRFGGIGTCRSNWSNGGAFERRQSH